MTPVSKLTVLIAGLLVSGSALAQAPAAPAAAPPPGTMVVKDVGLNGSESIRYDLYFDRYIVANTTAADQPGFISTLTPDGKVDQLKFIEGGKNGVTLDDPRGTYMRDGVLYVADKQHVRMFDLIDGKSKGEVNIPEAVTLNDLTVTADGVIYVTDSGSNDKPGSIFQIAADRKTVKRIVTGPQLKRPNGIDINPSAFQTGAQETAGFGQRATVAGGTSIVYVELDGQDAVTIDAAGKELSRVKLPSGRLDGIVYTDNGVMLVSSQQPGTIYTIDGNNRVGTLAEGFPAAAAIGWDSVRNRILIPQTRAGTVNFIKGPKIPGYPNG
jgi:sugar lactone lactonase YvrE